MSKRSLILSLAIIALLAAKAADAQNLARYVVQYRETSGLDEAGHLKAINTALNRIYKNYFRTAVDALDFDGIYWKLSYTAIVPTYSNCESVQRMTDALLMNYLPASFNSDLSVRATLFVLLEYSCNSDFISVMSVRNAGSPAPGSNSNASGATPITTVAGKRRSLLAEEEGKRRSLLADDEGKRRSLLADEEGTQYVHFFFSGMTHLNTGIPTQDQIVDVLQSGEFAMPYVGDYIINKPWGPTNPTKMTFTQNYDTQISFVMGNKTCAQYQHWGKNFSARGIIALLNEPAVLKLRGLGYVKCSASSEP